MSPAGQRRWARILGALLVSAIGTGCSGDGEADGAATTTTTVRETSTTAAELTFAGDPDSPFCNLIRSADASPVLDPFAADLEPREVELRLRLLRLRFADFADAAPPELDDDLAAVVTSLDQLAELLDANGYDFAAVVESGADVSMIDDPAFATIGTRLLAYREQVCDP